MKNRRRTVLQCTTLAALTTGGILVGCRELVFVKVIYGPTASVQEDRDEPTIDELMGRKGGIDADDRTE